MTEETTNNTTSTEVAGRGNNELLCCPFCGSDNISEGEALLAKDNRYHKQTGCADCGTLGPVSVCDDLYDDSKANAAWNRRAI